jgi:uncharacterized protein (DUF1697 family)
MGRYVSGIIMVMNTFVILVRGINVGGANKVPMADLRKCLEDLGFAKVSTYINSGNVILESDKDAENVKALIEEALPKNFSLNQEIIKVLVLSLRQLKAVINKKPKGFGDEPDKYYSDAIFLIDIDAAEAMKVFAPRDGVDKVWPGDEVIYSQRLGELRTKSRLNKIVGTSAYKSMTIRSWKTTTKLVEIMKSREVS